MANDLVLRFRGDEGNRQAFFGSIAKGPKEVADAITAANAQLLRTRSNIAPLPNRAGIFNDVRALKTELDSVNNVVKQVGQLGYTIRRATSTPGKFLDTFVPISEVKEIQGNVQEIIKSLNAYNAALERNDDVQKRVAASRATIALQRSARTDELRNAPRSIAARENLAALRAEREALIDRQLLQGEIVGRTSGAAQQSAIRKSQQLEAEMLALEKQITAAVRERDAARKAENRTIANDVRLNQLAAREQRLGAAGLTAAGRLAAAEAARTAAITGPVTSVPRNFDYLRQISPSLLRTLERGGLQTGLGPEYLQKQQFNAPRYDLVRDVTRFSGSFERSNGIIADWTAEVDRSGKVVTRFGGQLSGASQVMKQITRDFQKVIEWTVATTIVFGSLQYAIQQLSNLKELDAALTRFAITAQQSPSQATESFGQLAQIAYSTATPLLEIVSAADDIALATQRAGQSTDAWRQQIFALTESVGVFTNLTGIDTVQATDLLTATMKQLRLTANDIPAILSKITAVGGGQSQAIADITKGLSAMAEAGRVANLTVDQQIATVQVLSQVTSKTPAEVATSFKNLVGSLGSPAALKGLANFNIAVRDQEGELRNILDVYGEISDKIKSGIIPSGDVQGLIRAISGGPRRAPDAAALLAAVDQIATAQRKSEQATNEAAIANAKAIDTTKAKLIQLQTVIDSVTFEKFGGEFKTAIATFTSLLTALLKGFNAIPTGLITAGIQLGLFFVAVRAGTRILSFLGNYLRETAQGFIAVGSSAGQAAGQLTLFNQAGAPLGATGAKSGLRSLGIGGLARLGTGAAIGAGLTAASGGNLGQAIGGGLQGLGIGLLAIPSPDPITKIGGAIALLSGTLLQFAAANNEVAESNADKAIKVLDAYAQLKSASFDLGELTNSQEQLANQIERLSGQANKTADDMAALDNAQTDYAKGIVATIAATQQAETARQALIDTLKTSGNEGEQAIATELELAKSYGVTGQALKDLIVEYQKTILTRSNPELLFTDLSKLPSPQNVGYIPQTGDTTARFNEFDLEGASLAAQLDLTTLATKAEGVKNLFNFAGTEIIGQFEVTRENLLLIASALDKLEASGDPAAAGLQKTFAAFTSQNDIVIQTANNLKIYSAYLDALTFLDPEKAADLRRVVNLVQTVTNAIPAGPPALGPSITGAPLPDLRLEGLELLEKSFKGQEVPIEEVKQYALDFFNTIDLGSTDAADSIKFLGEFLGSLGYSFDELGIKGPAAMEEISEAALEAGENLGSSLNSLTSGITGRLSKLQADLQAGNIEPAQFKKANTDLREYLDLVGSIGNRFKDSIEGTAGFNEALQLLKPGFADIVGLEDAASLSSDQFIERLLTLADTYGVNGKNLDILAQKLADFHNLVEELNKLKVNIPIAITLDTTAIRAAIANLKRGLASSVGGPSTVGSPQVTAAFTALAALEKLASSLESTTGSIDKIYRSGSGYTYGSFPSGSTSGTKTTLDVSELDIPEEILQSPQMQQLLNEAIRNAKNLQSQIPGATKEAKNDIVVLLDGLTKVMQTQGVKSEYLRKALDELAEVERKRLEFETKADTIRRIRVGAGDFSAIANVPVNSTTGVSLGGAAGPINITLNLNGTVLTPAQLAQFADLVAGALKRQIAGG